MGEPVTPMQILLFQRDPDCSPCRVADSPLGSLGHRYRALGICLLVAVLSGTAGCARSSAASDAPPLQLEEVGAYAVPDSFHVASVNVADDGTVALLSDQASHLLVGKVGEFKEFGAGILKKPVAVALDAEGNVKEVVDAELGSILKFEGERVVSRVPVKARMSISSALHAGNDGWYIAGADSVGTVYVGHAEPDGTLPLRRVAKLSGPARGSIFMTAAPSGSIILTRAGYPHRWATVASSGRPVVKELFDTTKVLVDSDTSDLLDPFWVGQRVVPVGDYFLYELADLRSDHRKLLLISQHGSMVRETRFDVPMGFVSDEPDHSHLLAVRTLGQQELVAYQWHWGERPSGNQQHVERIIP